MYCINFIIYIIHKIHVYYTLHRNECKSAKTFHAPQIITNFKLAFCIKKELVGSKIFKAEKNLKILPKNCIISTKYAQFNCLIK